MRLVIDLQALQTASKFRGIGRYARSLARALLRLRGEHEIWIAVRNGQDAELDEIRSYFADLLPPGRFFVFSLFDDINFSNQANAWQREISECVRAFSVSLLCPDFVLNPSMVEGFDDAAAASCRPLLSYRNCAIVHDLIPFYDPESYIGSKLARQWYLEKLTEILLCDVLFCNSEFTRNDFLENMKFPDERVHSISAASEYQVNDDVTDLDDENILRDLGIGGRYFLFTGALEARKNPEIMIRAFSLLGAEHRQKLKIVFAGVASTTDRDRIEGFARGLGIRPKDRIIFLGFLPERELAALYRRCALFIFPSLSEGFGLPVLEAMACGAPILSSNRTSLPEVVGRADLLFDPYDAIALRDKIVKILEKPEYRAEIVAYGLARARTFSWDRTARQVIDVLERHVSERPRPDVQVSGSRRYFDYLCSVSAISEILDRYHVDEAGCRAAAQLIQKNMTTAAALLHGLDNAIPSWRVEGPFDSTYSLALVNRETARAFARLGLDVSLFSTEGPGDFDPNPAFLRDTPDIDRMYRRGREADARFTVVSRILYPPRVTRMNGVINLLHHYAWEETGFPREWIDEFNSGLNGFTCASRHVRKIMIDHGLRLPMAVTGNGVDHWDRVPAASHFHVEANGYRFLHVSSCFPRKGVDCLLEAYGNAFRRHDDVSLIIKTAHNPHNTVAEDLARLRAADAAFPDVRLIAQDLIDTEMKALYQQCHALVAPSRAEGFGLPIAEAILEGLPVIVTGWSGHLDFCDAETAWLVDYGFERARTHFNLPASVWAAPNIAHLSALMKEVRAASPAEIRKRSGAAIELLRNSYTWDHAAWRLQRYVADCLCFPAHAPRTAKIAWVTTWNTRCGIATYSQYMVGDRTDVGIFAPFTEDRQAPDGANVMRNWVESAGSLDRLFDDIDEAACDVVVIQFNYAFFVFAELAKFLERLLDQGRVVVFEAHAVHEKDPDQTRRLASIVAILGRCHRVMVHSINDLNRLKGMGLVDNVTLFPHPYVSRVNLSVRIDGDRRRFAGERLIASYGFFLPNKGLVELIKAFEQLVRSGVDGHLLLVNAEYPVSTSRELIETAKNLVAALSLGERVTLVNDFLADEESLAYLREADLVILPYQMGTGDSASGAVRLCLASGRPVAVTPLPIFDDVEGAVLRLPGCEVADLVEGIRAALADIEVASPRIKAVVNEAERLVSELSYLRMSKRYFDMLESLHINRCFDVYSNKEAGKPVVAFPTLIREFRPAGGVVKTRVGRLDDRGHLYSDGRKGLFTYGPYTMLRPSRYRLRAFGTWSGAANQRAQLRVVTDEGQNILHELEIGRPDRPTDGCLFDTEFVSDRVYEGVEFLLSIDAGLRLSLGSYLLEECSVNGVTPRGKASRPVETIFSGAERS